MTGPPTPRVCLVGELRVERGATVHRAVALGSRKARTLLAVLATEPHRLRPAGELAEALWPEGDAPDSSEATIASLVSRLRRTLGPEVVSGGRAGYRLGPDVDVDLELAEQLVLEADRRLSAGQPALAGSASAAAVGLLAGTALPDAGDAAWVHATRTRHAALQRRARATGGHALVEVGDYARAAEVARTALADDPLDESAARTLMTALAAVGEPAAALQVFEELRQRLGDELGSDPAPLTAALHTDILRGRAPVDRAPARSTFDGGVLVGREAEFAQLRAAWSAAAGGAGSLVLITGDPGAGKTRLADEVRRLATDTGGAVLAARCYEAERALFLQPFVEAVTAAVTRQPAAVIRAAASQHLDSLARLVPAIGALTHGNVSTGRMSAEVERRRAVEGMSALLCGLARDHPVLVLLDDLHNAGTSSIELLHYLRTALPTAGLLVVATVRSDEGAEALAALGSVSTRVEVGPLPAAAVRQLAVAAGQGHNANEIITRTGGHALFVAEILRGQVEGDNLPATLQAAVLARAAKVGGSAEAVLRAGAVLGASFDPQHAAELAGVPRAQGLADCERALQIGLLRAAGRTYEFANDLVREVLYATTPTPTRLAHHAHSVDLLTGAPEQVARHAIAIEDWPRAGRAWLLAAENALRSFAATDGVVLAGRALAAAERAGDVELAGRALVVRGRAHEIRAAYTPAWDDFAAAVTAARTAGDRRLEMNALREVAGNVPVALGRAPATIEEPLRQCLRLARGLGDRTTEADVLGRLTVLAVTRLDFVTARECSAQAMRAAQACGEERALELALDAGKNYLAYLGEIDQLENVVQELEPLNRRLGDLTLLQWTVFESALVPLAKGDHAAAAERIEAALSVCRRSGYTPYEPFYVAHLAWVHRLAGDLDTALSIGANAVAAAREHSHAWWLSTAAALQAGTLLQAGRAEEAVTLLTGIRASVEVAGAQGYLARCLGPLAEAGGDLEILKMADTLLREIAVPDGSAWLMGADAYLSVARAWRDQGEPERARVVLTPFLAAARRVGWADLVRAGEHALQ